MVTELVLTNETVAKRLTPTIEPVRGWVIACRREVHPVQLHEELNAVEELRAAKRQISQLQMENEFLKKAAASFGFVREQKQQEMARESK